MNLKEHSENCKTKQREPSQLYSREEILEDFQDMRTNCYMFKNNIIFCNVKI
jgi:hypothetical protein